MRRERRVLIDGYAEIEVDDLWLWSQFVDIFELERRVVRWKDELSSERGKRWIFRGQSDSDWPLASSLERFCFQRYKTAEKRLFVEKRMMDEFVRRMSSLAASVPEDMFDRLSLMQHYGVPTRLLDFTTSAYVALWFAAEAAKCGEKFSVWAVCVDELFQHLDCPEVVDVKACNEAKFPCRAELIDGHTTDEILGGESVMARRDQVLAAYPRLGNPRLNAQSGLFLLQPKLDYPFMHDLMACVKSEKRHWRLSELCSTHKIDDLRFDIARFSRLIKFDFQRLMRQYVLRRLKAMNIYDQTLFPDVGGVARTVARMFDPEELVDDFTEFGM